MYQAYFSTRTYNNNAENVLFLWINQNNGKIFMGVQQNPNRTLSSNKINGTGKIQKTAKSSKNFKEDWVYNAKFSYENNMVNPSRHRSLPINFYNDFHSGDEFKPLLIYFNREQEGFDFRNDLFELLHKYNMTYNKNEVKSKINPTDNEKRKFESFMELEYILKNNSVNIADQLERFFSGLYEDGMYTDNLESTSINSNEVTRKAEMNNNKKVIDKPKYCQKCNLELNTVGKCLECDF